MRISDADILIVPGLGNSGPDHWQSRWQAKLSTARRVEQDDWDHPEREAWVNRLVETVQSSSRPAIIIAHSIGVITTVFAAERLKGHVIGAMLVAPSDWDKPDLLPGYDLDFNPIPMTALPFSSLLVASRNDPYCEINRATAFAEAWNSEFVDAGEAGHINVESGHGPWPEGLLRLASFLSKLKHESQ
ncbi:RBBP9/YdeN family alpha/beta hydrolase [Labrys neptuniae]|uniref:Alpha/beta hydrolase n=1 Tax=Labrys neptuniae TaxID=376174 RepID=A0ABV3PX16_9HYPH